jgi:hypothetical protein
VLVPVYAAVSTWFTTVLVSIDGSDFGVDDGLEGVGEEIDLGLKKGGCRIEGTGGFPSAVVESSATQKYAWSVTSLRVAVM